MPGAASSFLFLVVRPANCQSSKSPKFQSSTRSNETERSTSTRLQDASRCNSWKDCSSHKQGSLAISIPNKAGTQVDVSNCITGDGCVFVSTGLISVPPAIKSPATKLKPTSSQFCGIYIYIYILHTHTRENIHRIHSLAAHMRAQKYEPRNETGHM